MSGLPFKNWAGLGAFVLLAVGAVVYRFSLDIGFWTDDYSFLEFAGRLSLPDYLAHYFDPRFQVQWYRPLHAMLWWVVYVLMGRDPFGYHLAQVIIHLANCVLLYMLVTRVTRKWRLAFLAALVYVTLPIYTLAVNWPGVADPLVSLFYLLAIWFWLDYLESGKKLYYALTLLAVIGAMLSKEIGAVLPFTLVMAELWLVRKSRGFSELLKRYALLFLTLPIYALLEFPAVTQGVFTQRQGYGVGGHILAALVEHLSTLAFPWGIEPPLNYLWLAVVLALILWAATKRATSFLFLATAAVLAVLPVAPLALNLARASRYLYLPLMASAIGVAALVEFLRSKIRWRWAIWAGALALAILIGSSSMAIGEEAVNFAGTTRQVRLQFRPIFQKHATFEPDTLLYFIQPPFPSPNIGGLMFQRYGQNVRVYGTDRDRMPNLRSYRAAFIYYPDDQNNWKEQTIEKGVTVRATPDARVQFGPSIALLTFELASAHVKRGEAVVLILYWQNTGKIEKDYQVFTHLVDANGQNVAGYDAQPRQGYSPTSRWGLGEKLADSAVIPIDASVPAGEYKLELGLYVAETMERLPVLDGTGLPMSDKLVIEPIYVAE